MHGPGSKDMLSEGSEHNDLSNDVWSSVGMFDCMTGADLPFEMPLTCLEAQDGTFSLELPPSSETAISSPAALQSPADNVDSDPLGDIHTNAEDEPCDGSCPIIFSPQPASGSPAGGGPPPPQFRAPDAPAVPIEPPVWAESHFMGNAQQAADLSVPTGEVAAPNQVSLRPAVAAEPPSTPLQQPLLPRVPAAPKASKPRRGFTQRNRVRSMVQTAHSLGRWLVHKAQFALFNSWSCEGGLQHVSATVHGDL